MWGQLLLLAIGALLLLSIIGIVFELWHFLFREQAALEQMENNLLQMNEQGQSLTKTLEVLGKNCSPISEAMKRLKTIYYLKTQNQVIVPGSYLPSDTLRRESTFTSIGLRFTPLFAILLGLTGMFAGLSQTTVQIWNLLDQSGSDTFMQFLNSENFAPNKLILPASPFRDGATIVFAGFFASIILYLFLFPLKVVKAQFFAKLELFTTTYLLPIFTSSTENQLSKLVEQVAQNTQLNNTTVHHLAHTSQLISVEYEKLSQLSANLATGIEAFILAQDTLTQTFNKFQNLYQNQGTLSGNDALDNYKIVEALNLHNATIAQLTDRLNHTEFDFLDWLKDIIALSQQQHQEFKNELKAIIELTRSNLSNTQSAGNRFDISTKKFKDSLDDLEELLKSFSDIFKESVQKEVVKFDEVGDKIQSLHNLVQNLQKDIPAQLSRMANILDTTNQLANPTYIEQMARTIASDTIKAQIADYAKEYQRLEDQIAELEKRLKKTNKSLLGDWVQKVLIFLGLGK